MVPSLPLLCCESSVSVKENPDRNKNIEKKIIYIYIFFSIWVFYHDHSRITGLQGKGEGTSLTPHYHFHPLHKHLDISRAITAESSPLHIASSRGLEPGTFGFRAQVATFMVSLTDISEVFGFALTILISHLNLMLSRCLGLKSQ